MRSYFFFMQGKKRRRCLASTSRKLSGLTQQKDEQTLFVNLEEDGQPTSRKM